MIDARRLVIVGLMVVMTAATPEIDTDYNLLMMQHNEVRRVVFDPLTNCKKKNIDKKKSNSQISILKKVSPSLGHIDTTKFQIFKLNNSIYKLYKIKLAAYELYVHAGYIKADTLVDILRNEFKYLRQIVDINSDSVSTMTSLVENRSIIAISKDLDNLAHIKKSIVENELSNKYLLLHNKVVYSPSQSQQYQSENPIYIDDIVDLLSNESVYLRINSENDDDMLNLEFDHAEKLFKNHIVPLISTHLPNYLKQFDLICRMLKMGFKPHNSNFKELGYNVSDWQGSVFWFKSLN